MKKKVIALGLCASLLFALCLPASAAEIPTDTAKMTITSSDGKEETVFFDLQRLNKRMTHKHRANTTLGGVAKTWMNVAGIMLSASGILQEACQVVEENAYTYIGGKEIGIYDPTSNKRQVEVYATWGDGRITMTWSYNSSTGYRNPTWGHSTRSPGLQATNTSVRDEGQRIYNTNILTYGLWKWGVGNGFGY